jgi:hypothetical protein
MCHGGSGGHARGERNAQGPFVVDVSADSLASGKASEPLVITDVPAGSYRGSELEIEPLEKDGRASADAANLADFRDGSTVIIDGSSHGSAFTYKASFEAEQESTKAFTVKAKESLSLALTVDASTWFTDADGRALDPANAADHAAIAQRIQASLTIDPDAGRHGGHDH